MGDLDRKTGFLKMWQQDKGYGFIECDDDSPDVFCHIDNTIGTGFRQLFKGQRVSFFVVQSERGPQSRQLMLVKENGDTVPVPTASEHVPRPIGYAGSRMPGVNFADVALRDKDQAVAEQRAAYLKDLATRAPSWVSAARGEQLMERAEAPKVSSPAKDHAVTPASVEHDLHETDGQRTYILSALAKIQSLTRSSVGGRHASMQIRRLAANIELIIEAPESPEALQFGESDALNLDW